MDKDGNKTGGRIKGVPNHIPAKLRNDILAAFEKEDIEKGVPSGEDWLMELKRDFKPVFAGLLSKILPKEVAVEITESTKTFTLNMNGLAHNKTEQPSMLPELPGIGPDDKEIIEGETVE